MQKGLDDLGSHGGAATLPQPDTLECEVKWALGNIVMNKSQ